MERTGLFPNCEALTFEIIENELLPLVMKKGWGFSMADCLRMIGDHMDGDTLTKEKIEFILEDCNFHTLNGFLSNEEYIRATEWVLKEYTEEE